jgi:hypothetical protein
MAIELTNDDANLGDTLALTPMFKNEYGSIKILDCPKTREVYRIFDGIANVEFTKNKVSDCAQTKEQLPKGQRILNHFLKSDVSCIPFVKITEEEKEWGKKELERKGIKNSIAVNLSAKEKDSYRTIPEHVILGFLEKYKDTHQFLQFGLSEYVEPTEGFIQMLDYDIRQLIALFWNIKKYVGCDTGDYHLMLAVGGECEVLIPPTKFPDYHYPFHLYLESLWKDEKSRVKYYIC